MSQEFNAYYQVKLNLHTLALTLNGSVHKLVPMKKKRKKTHVIFKYAPTATFTT